MFYLLDWLRNRLSKWVNNSYPFSKNSPTDGDSKIISHSFSNKFIRKNKFSQNTKLSSNDPISPHKDLNIISRTIDHKTPMTPNDFSRIKKKIEGINLLSYANQFCNAGK